MNAINREELIKKATEFGLKKELANKKSTGWLKSFVAIREQTKITYKNT